jgi:hypothetical protein
MAPNFAAAMMLAALGTATDPGHHEVFTPATSVADPTQPSGTTTSPSAAAMILPPPAFIPSDPGTPGSFIMTIAPANGQLADMSDPDPPKAPQVVTGVTRARVLAATGDPGSATRSHDPTVIPEPSSVPLLAVALGGIILLMRIHTRRRR